ncbi:P44/Msp2 family outer membrane protein [Candidatus Anaplasma sp. TIGMIC]|uniref:P44/Msp2 family outer membrane protein n=1 Tax=Candidatus Anaplasma sp. TIGMIC TaxID=3020713 RepID=UPI00232C1CB1|nr:P44/Msp2 family outer membrane protein [Candidatus Anaplasma sp. TIGMIC]MDB1135762.1 P44/Msp2 family outer membrane protein [Candidatus Anaplasma sp. TIGMIC]
MAGSCIKAVRLGVPVLVSVVILFFDPSWGCARGSFELHNSSHGAYVGLSYAPALQGVKNFKIGEPFNNGTRAVIPYIHDAGVEVLKADKFDWAATDTKIAFGSSSVIAMVGSIGLAHQGGSRMELEMGHRSFPAYFHDESGNHDNTTGFYLLVKSLAFNVVNGNTPELRDGLAAQSPEDIESFAHTLKASHPDVDKMMCKNGKKLVAKSSIWAFGKVYRREDEYRRDCSGQVHEEKWPLEALPRPGIAAAVTGQGQNMWPKVSQTTRTFLGELRPAVDASPQVADEITNMSAGNRAIVAGFLAKTIEGGEVVKITSVSSTSVMVNACYDLMFVGRGSLVPYACVGLGGDFVAVAGRISPKPAFKLEAGLGYKLFPSVYAYGGWYIHHVIGDGEYDNLPVLRLVDDSSPDGRTKDYATASFGLSYSGGELGVRLVF